MPIALAGLLAIVLCLPAYAEPISRVDFDDAPVVQIVQALAKSAGVDVVIAGDQAAAQAKKATVHLKEIDLDEAIDRILRANGFNYEKRGGVLLVSSLPQDLAQTAYQPEVAVISLNYLGAARAAELLTKMLPAAVFLAGGRAGTLDIKGSKNDLDLARQLLAGIDRKTPQLLIESKVMELSQSDSLRLGLSYGTGAYKFITGKETKKTRPADDLVTTLNALAADGRATVVANPRIATLDNQEAVINIGNRIPYAVPVTSGGTTTQWTVDYIDAGVKLKVTPQLGEAGEITALIQPEVSSISEWRTTAAGDFPVIATRNASATVRVKSGETIIIGGLLSETERENVSRVPVLGYLPVVGLLFQNKIREKERTEIVFLITPHLI
jgi:type II secretory pathway component GspD/PulD (secretin)